ncbi:B3 domain-containing protein REM9-like [Dendrobium catenatum]|nr:B3 domain-containing protein REM9-like [Dendrobium catenatum]
MSRLKVEKETLSPKIETIDSSSGFVGYSFFRLLFPDSNFMKQLRLPRSFGDHVQIEKPNKQIAELINRKAKSWKVNLNKDPEGFFCFTGEGWKKLARAHHLKLGYFLTFDYNGGMLFNFRIFGLNTTEIQNYPSQEEKKCNEEDEEKANIFEAVIHSSNLSKPYMNIPKKCKKLTELSKDGGKGKVVLIDEKGRKWPVRLSHKAERGSTERFFIYSGWLEFVHGNGLRRGDRCVFELVCLRFESFIKVRIIRCGV